MYLTVKHSLSSSLAGDSKAEYGWSHNVVSIMASSLPSFLPFDMDEDQLSVGPRWAKWVNLFDNFLAALNIADDARRKPLILHYAGLFSTTVENAYLKSSKL